MKKFVLLHIGFKTPTKEIMAAWGKWFASIADRGVDQVGFGAGREVCDAGTKDLPLGLDSITAFNIITAENLDEAESIAKECPYISSIRVYEVRSNSPAR